MAPFQEFKGPTDTFCSNSCATPSTLSDIQPGEAFSIRDLRVHLLAQGQRYTPAE